MPSLTQAAFAKEVGLSRGRIAQLVGEGLPVEPDGGIDLKKGKRWIADNLDPKRREAATGTAPEGKLGMVAAMRAQKLLRETKLIDMEVKRKEGSLLDRAEVEKAIFERARFERDAWIGWVSRAAAELAAETGADPQIIFAGLDRRVREQLYALSSQELDLSGDKR
ncbi:hypothetical protein [Aestuariivirga sp.]|uniref:hypothetical protein n=1 Tax=Aestuariivirga sp. TaxID=2650926 RepID=UPI00391D8E1D